MISWSAASVDTRVGAVLVLLVKALALGAGVAVALTLLNAIALVFTTRANPVPGIAFWAIAYLRLFNSVNKLGNEERSSERRDVLALMGALAPVAILSALPLSDILLSASIQMALGLNPDAAVGVLFE